MTNRKFRHSNNSAVVSRANRALERSFFAVNGILFGAKNRELYQTLEVLKQTAEALVQTDNALLAAEQEIDRLKKEKP